MKKHALLILLLLVFTAAFAQSISVKSFQPLPMDMTASSLEGKRIDRNGQVAALIKVVTTEKNFSFEGGTLGIVDSQQRKGEIWVWVPRGLRKITILHDQLGVLRDYRFPDEIEAERTYEMVLITAKVETVIKEDVHQQYLLFQLDPPNAILEVDDMLWSVEADGTSMKYVDFGTYTYRVRASDYITEAGMVTVDDPENTRIVPVKLKSNMVEVTLTVDADAEIWVNNEKKGTRTWTGSLGKGTYRIECRQEGHETTMVSKEITAEMIGQTVTLPVPRPVYGSLNVETTPNLCKLYVDGKYMGLTPKSINEILVGQHEILLSKQGYVEHKETIAVKKGERKQLQISLQRQEVATVTTVANTPVSVSEESIEGKFSVSRDKQVRFSKGNLQYQASTGKWRFAENQWDIIGEDNKNISSSYTGWIDLFGWGTGDDPVKSSEKGDDYSGFTDWGDEMSGDWRTLTREEWKYVFDKRRTSSGIRYAKAIVNGVSGMILLPDNWNKSNYDLRRTNDSEASFKSNSISQSDWRAHLESNGAIFLPAAGYRKGSSVSCVGSYGGYWSASPQGKDCACGVYFASGNVYTNNYDYCYIGFSVRLVRPAKN